MSKFLFSLGVGMVFFTLTGEFVFASTLYSQNFDGFSTGVVQGQDSWYAISGSTGNFNVTATHYFSSPYGLTWPSTTGTSYVGRDPGSNPTTGDVSGKFYYDSSLDTGSSGFLADFIVTQSTNNTSGTGFYLDRNRNVHLEIFNGSVCSGTSVSTDQPVYAGQWNIFEFTWSKSGSTTDLVVYINHTPYEYVCTDSAPGTRYMVFGSNGVNASDKLYIDDILFTDVFGPGVVVPISKINNQTEPLPNAITSSALTRLTFNYTNVDFYSIAGAVIHDRTVNQSIAQVEETHNGSGTFTYSELMQLTPNHFYTVQPYVRDPSSGARIVGDIVFFSTVSNANNIASLIASTTTNYTAAYCNVLVGFDFFKCAQYMLLPDATSTQVMAQVLVTNVGVGGPVTLAANLGTALTNAEAASTTYATSSLPTLYVTMPNGFPGGGQTFNLTPWDYLLGPGSMLSTATDPNTGLTLKQIVYPGWCLFVYLMFILAVSSEVLGLGGKVIANSI